MNIKYLIVDGSNVARELYGYDREMGGSERRALDNRNSKRLLSLMAAFHSRLAIPEIKVYFDGTARPQEITPRNLPICISMEFSAGTQADELIVAEARYLAHMNAEVAVVTDDRELQYRVRQLGLLNILSVFELEPMAQDAGLNTDLYFHSA